jgi:hypothetical protein
MTEHFVYELCVPLFIIASFVAPEVTLRALMAVLAVLALVLAVQTA